MCQVSCGDANANLVKVFQIPKEFAYTKGPITWRISALVQCLELGGGGGICRRAFYMLFFRAQLKECACTLKYYYFIPG